MYNDSPNGFFVCRRRGRQVPALRAGQRVQAAAESQPRAKVPAVGRGERQPLRPLAQSSEPRFVCV